MVPHSSVDLRTTLAGVALEHPLLNAAGPLNVTEEQLLALAQSEVAAVVTKSATLEPRDGNLKPRWMPLPQGGFQSMGLPNLGIEAYLKIIPQLKEFGKPVILSLSGLKLEDNLKMLERAQSSGADMIEVNLSCPNIAGKPQIGYDFVQAKAYLEAISRYDKIPLAVKLPPYLDPELVAQIGALIQVSAVAVVVTINSVGNCLVIDAKSRSTKIRGKSGFGGLSGAMIKPIGLGNVRLFHEFFGASGPQIIGVGGVQSAEDVLEYILAGASAVQIGTSFLTGGIETFARIKQELTDLLAAQKVESLLELRGALQPCTREADPNDFHDQQ